MAKRHFPASEALTNAELLINVPVQKRSADRLTALLDATAAVIEAEGYEELTTADVAKQAGASIGTVYRYFTDRVALLKALAVRNFELTDGRMRAAIGASDTPAGAIESLFEMYAALFVEEPGYRSIRLGDVLDIHPRPAIVHSRRAAITVARELNAKFGTADDEATIDRFEYGFILVDALLGRAHVFSRTNPDAAFVTKAKQVATQAADNFR